MKISAMRAIDRYVGVFLCWVVGLPLYLASRQKEPLPGEPKRILVIKFFGLGSIVLATPALSALRERYPAAQIEFLSFEGNRELLERYSIVDAVHIVRTSSARKFLRDTYSVVRTLRGRRFDVVFDFEFFSKYSTLISTLTRSRHRIGFSLPARWRALHLTQQVPIRKDEHVAYSFSRQVALLRGEHAIPRIAAPRTDRSDTLSLVEKLPLNGRPVIAVNVNAGETFIERRWPGERFASLLASIADEVPHDFYFIGLAHERELIDRVIAQSGIQRRCYDVAGMLSVGELCEFFRRCDLLISNDSGPVHLAAALGLRTVALFGPETPSFYGPLSTSAITVAKPIPCSPCMNVYAAKTFQCPYDAACMKAITVDDVKLAVEEILQKA